MLLLRRKKNQKILIGNGIEVEVTAVEGGQVILGITAPKDVRVDREEVAERRKQKCQAETAAAIA